MEPNDGRELFPFGSLLSYKPTAFSDQISYRENLNSFMNDKMQFKQNSCIHKNYKINMDFYWDIIYALLKSLQLIIKKNQDFRLICHS